MSVGAGVAEGSTVGAAVGKGGAVGAGGGRAVSVAAGPGAAVGALAAAVGASRRMVGAGTDAVLDGIEVSASLHPSNARHSPIINNLRILAIASAHDLRACLKRAAWRARPFGDLFSL